VCCGGGVRDWCKEDTETSLTRFEGAGRGGSLGSTSLSSDIIFDFRTVSCGRTAGIGAGCC
jgi:hypothetical protein